MLEIKDIGVGGHGLGDGLIKNLIDYKDITLD